MPDSQAEERERHTRKRTTKSTTAAGKRGRKRKGVGKRRGQIMIDFGR